MLYKTSILSEIQKLIFFSQVHVIQDKSLVNKSQCRASLVAQ